MPSEIKSAASRTSSAEETQPNAEDLEERAQREIYAQALPQFGRQALDEWDNLVDQNIPSEIKSAASKISSAKETQRDAEDREERAQREIYAEALPLFTEQALDLDWWQTLLQESTDREPRATTEPEQYLSSIFDLQFSQNRAAYLESQDLEYRQLMWTPRARKDVVVVEPEEKVNSLKAIATRLKKLSDDLASSAMLDPYYKPTLLSIVEEMCVQARGVDYEQIEEMYVQARGVGYEQIEDAVQKLRFAVHVAET